MPIRYPSLVALTLAGGVCVSPSLLALSTPRLDVKAQWGSDTTSGWASLSQPFYQSQRSAGLLMGQYEANGLSGSPSSNIASVGLGWRHQLSNGLILGGYAFGDRLYTPRRTASYVASPGLDLQGQNWLFALNTYIPLYQKHVLMTNWGDLLGIRDTLRFVGHTVYGQRFDVFEQGMLGGDLRVGFRPASYHRLSFSLGGYYYHPEHPSLDYKKDIYGLKTGVTFHQSGCMSLSGEYRYDAEYHSRVIVSLGVSLRSHGHRDWLGGGLTGPVLRHMNINTTQRGVPVSREYRLHPFVAAPTPTPPPVPWWSAPEYNNVYFVRSETVQSSGGSPLLMSASASSGDGTYEHPFTTLQAAVTAMSSAPEKSQIWLAGGHTYAGGEEINMDKTKTLTIAGRTADWQIPTYGNDNKAAKVHASGAGVSGLTVTKGQVTLKGFAIQVEGTGSTNFGLKVNGGPTDGTTVDLQAMKISADSSSFAHGVDVAAGNTLTISGDTSTSITATSTSTGNYAVGIYNNFGGTATINGSNTSITSTGSFAYAIYNAGGTATINGSNTSITAKSTGSFAYAIYNAGGTATINGSNTSITATATAGNAYGIYNSGTVTFSNDSLTSITAQGDQSQEPLSKEEGSGSSFSKDNNATVECRTSDSDQFTTCTIPQ